MIGVVRRLLDRVRSILRAFEFAPTNRVDLWAFECGDGDTLLLSINRRHWFLIDCNLPSRPIGCRRRFFNFLESIQMRDLEGICLTHPHADHYTGMLAVLEYFEKTDRRIRYFFDCGLEPRQIQSILKQQREPRATQSEFEKLYRKIYQMSDNGRIDYVPLSSQSKPFAIGNTGVHLVPVGPKPDVVNRASRRTLETGKVVYELNLLSVVLGLHATDDLDNFDLLLTGDSDGEGINHALEQFSEFTRVKTPYSGLDCVKVAHHGSKQSHHNSRILEAKKKRKAAAALVSVGTSFKVLPDKQVIFDYLENGWRVLLTNKRVSTSKRDYIIGVANRDPSPWESTPNDIKISWITNGDIVFTPAGSEVHWAELSSYSSASS